MTPRQFLTVSKLVISLTGASPDHWPWGVQSNLYQPLLKTKGFQHKLAKSNQHLNQLIGIPSHHQRPFLSLRVSRLGWLGWQAGRLVGKGIAKGNRVAYEAALEGALEAALEGKKKFGKRTTQPCPWLPSRLVRETKCTLINAGGRCAAQPPERDMLWQRPALILCGVCERESVCVASHPDSNSLATLASKIRITQQSSQVFETGPGAAMCVSKPQILSSS